MTVLIRRSLAWPLLLLLLLVGPAEPKSINNEDDGDGVCEWDDQQKCQEEATRKRKNSSLPDAEGGADYVDDEYDGEYDDDDDGEEEEEEDDENDEEAVDGEEEDDDDEEVVDGESEHEHDDFGDNDDNDDSLPHEYRVYPEEGEEWDVWKHGGKGDLYQALDCPDYGYGESTFDDTSFENIHTVETWSTFNRIYNEVIAATKGDPELEQESTIPPVFEKNGFQFPIEIKFDSVVGRGVYALTDIPKGSLLYISTNNAAFLNGQTYRNFLKALPSKLGCDVSIWAFVRWVSLESDETDEHMVCVDLDEGSFVNSADSDEAYNMALGNDEGTLYTEGTYEEQIMLWSGCKMKFWASRDIKKGEEIRADYDDFVEEDGWKYLSL